MKTLDFKPHKNKKDFLKNYSLHDLAEKHGKNLLIQWGIGFTNFGDDLRKEKVWEKGKDKPDLKINYKNKIALIDWKGKHDSVWKLNQRAFEAYFLWGKKLALPVLVVFFVFNEKNSLFTIRCANLQKHVFLRSDKKEWDKNQTVIADSELPLFTKGNLLNNL